jgi:hypothetical protein
MKVTIREQKPDGLRVTFFEEAVVDTVEELQPLLDYFFKWKNHLRKGW